MKRACEVKSVSFCPDHATQESSKVCMHIKESLSDVSLRYEFIVPIFIERILFDKYYERYWFCENCARDYGIKYPGELHYDSKLRECFEQDSMCMSDDNLEVSLKPEFLKMITYVCRECFLAHYNHVVQRVESHPELLNEKAIL